MKRLDAVIGPGVPFPAVTSGYECELPGELYYVIQHYRFMKDILFGLQSVDNSLLF